MTRNLTGIARILVCLAAFQLPVWGQVSSTSPPKEWMQALALFNRGAALMEQYQYPEAAQAFEETLVLAPDWTAARFNYGLAYFNMQGQKGAVEFLEKARVAFEAVLKDDPEFLHARFCLGLYYEHLGKSDEALLHFKQVYQADSENPYVVYKYAEALLRLNQFDEGTRMLERVMERDPGFVSAIYRLATQYMRSGKREAAMPLFQRFRELSQAELTGGSHTVQKAYGTAGRYYLAVGADRLPLPAFAESRSTPIVFSPEIIELIQSPPPGTSGDIRVQAPSLAAGDWDGDGDLDLCVTAAAQEGASASVRILVNDGSGQFSVKTIENIGDMVPFSICPGDVDNDGDLDLWIGGAEGVRLLDGDGKGQFKRLISKDLSTESRTAVSVRLADVDSDGDLDLLAVLSPSQGPSVVVYNNNRDGQFPSVTESLGLAFTSRAIGSLIYDDLDADRDLDFLVLPSDNSPPILWANDRAGQYRLLDSHVTGLEVTEILGATTGDVDKDGMTDILLFTKTGLRLFLNKGRLRFSIHPDFESSGLGADASTGMFADMDNDGDLDIVVGDARRGGEGRGPAILINEWPKNRFTPLDQVDPGNLLAALESPERAACLAGDFTGDGRLDLIWAPWGEPIRLLVNATPQAGNWIEIDLAGARPQDGKSRSNQSAVGARVEVKTGRLAQQFSVGAAAGNQSVAPYRIHVGLGEYQKVEWLRIIWPDGVLQAELELAANRRITITELQRKTSSCPLLFAWTGEQFEFVSDFGGVGGLGYLAEPGVYGMPDPVEILPLPPLVAVDGEYVFQSISALEEVIYFDAADLIAVDHPVGTQVLPYELMAISLPPPDFEVFCFDRPIDPIRVTDHRGRDVTDLVTRQDRRCAGATDLDHRFIGLAAEHSIELDFSDQLRAVSPTDRLILFAYGWVEYGYSATNYAAGQAGLRCEAPTIEVWRKGQWIPVFEEVGYPAGINHWMALDVTGRILPSDSRIRIVSNMELYWDRIFLGIHQSEIPLKIQSAPIGSADLHFYGYPREYSPDGYHPNLYDYSNADRAVAWKLMPGVYTRYGDVTELIAEVDDCYVIMAHGEELTLRFPAEAFGPVREGWTRSFMLRADSYCKDMDLYTAFPESIDPLPFHGMSGYPYRPDEAYPDTEKTRAYRREFNTRRLGQ